MCLNNGKPTAILGLKVWIRNDFRCHPKATASIPTPRRTQIAHGLHHLWSPADTRPSATGHAYVRWMANLHLKRNRKIHSSTVRLWHKLSHTINKDVAIRGAGGQRQIFSRGLNLSIVILYHIKRHRGTVSTKPSEVTLSAINVSGGRVFSPRKPWFERRE